MTADLHRKDSVETEKSRDKEPVDSLSMGSSIDQSLLIFLFLKAGDENTMYK